MSDMDGFLGKVLNDSISGSKEHRNNMDGYSLIGQRQVNLVQQENITNQKEYIRELEQAVKKLKSEVDTLKKTNLGNSDDLIYDPFTDRIISPGQEQFEQGVNQGYRKATQEYKELLTKPMQVIAEQNGDFKKTYEEQQALLAEWMVSQKAFKELAIQFGFDAHGHTPEHVIEMGLDKKIDVLEDRHDPSHNTIAGDSTIIGPRKEKLVEKYHKDKATRKAKKGS